MRRIRSNSERISEKICGTAVASADARSSPNFVRGTIMRNSAEFCDRPHFYHFFPILPFVQPVQKNFLTLCKFAVDFLGIM